MNVCAKSFAVLVSLLALSGCAAKTRYVWRDYDTKLYSHYKDPAQKEEFYQALKETLDDAESSGRIPPGIYAEYGYVLYEQGNSSQAILYYQKEADLWPESRFFMTKLINMAKKRNKAQVPPTTPTAAPEADAKQVVTAPPEVSK